jgi:hypothetical protein
MAEKSKEDICAGCDHQRGSHGVGMCIGSAHAAAPGQRVQVGCEAFVEILLLAMRVVVGERLALTSSEWRW